MLTSHTRKAPTKCLAAATTALAIFSAYASDSAATYEVDSDHSSVAFTVAIMGGLSHTTGHIGKFKSAIRYDAKDVTKSSVEARLEPGSIETGIEARDVDLKSAAFFDVKKFPTVTFQSTSIVRKAKGLIAIGNLTMHGVTRKIEIPFRISGVGKTSDGPVIGFEGGVTIDRKDYGMRWHSDMVSDKVAIQLSLLAQPK